MEALFSLGQTVLCKSLLGIHDNIMNEVEQAIHWASLLFIDVCLVDWHYTLYIFVSVLFHVQNHGKLIFNE